MKEHKLSKNDKIFMMCRGYQTLFKKFIDAMLRRGWHRNMDHTSRIFDLKFVMFQKEIYDKSKLQYNTALYDFQKVNKMLDVGVMSTKFKLTN